MTHSAGKSVIHVLPETTEEFKIQKLKEFIEYHLDFKIIQWE